MGIKSIVDKPQKAAKETPVEQPASTNSRRKPVDPITLINKKWREWFVVNKVMENGTLARTRLRFETNDEYLDWIIDEGPDRDLKDPEGEYVVIRTWLKK